MTKNKKNQDVVRAAEIGAGIVAIGAAAAAGYYFYATKDAKTHRKELSSWASGLKKEVIREVKKLKTMDAESVAHAIDSAVATYEGVRSIKRADVNRAARELKTNWQKVKQEAVKDAPKRRTPAKAKKK